jgi:hypothetical protein
VRDRLVEQGASGMVARSKVGLREGSRTRWQTSTDDRDEGYD